MNENARLADAEREKILMLLRERNSNGFGSAQKHDWVRCQKMLGRAGACVSVSIFILMLPRECLIRSLLRERSVSHTIFISVSHTIFILMLLRERRF